MMIMKRYRVELIQEFEFSNDVEFLSSPLGAFCRQIHHKRWLEADEGSVGHQMMHDFVAAINKPHCLSATLVDVDVMKEFQDEVDQRDYMQAERNPSFRLELDGEPITLIEWVNVADVTSIRQIETTTTTYLCRVTKTGSLLAQEDSDDPIQGDYWVAADVPSPQLYGNCVRRVDLPTTLEFQSLLVSALIVEEIKCCQICDEYTEIDGETTSRCGHLCYSYKLASWCGCGYCEDDLSADYRAAFQALATKISAAPVDVDDSISKVVQWLRDRQVRQLWWLSDRYIGLDDNFEPACQYLKSFTAEVPQSYFDQVIRWLTQQNKHDGE